MDIFIKHAYAYSEAKSFFQTITTETILELYTELDYVYDLLESLGIVSRYMGNSILLNFEVIKETMFGNKIYICVGENRKELDIERIINEIVKVFLKRE